MFKLKGKYKIEFYKKKEYVSEKIYKSIIDDVIIKTIYSLSLKYDFKIIEYSLHEFFKCKIVIKADVKTLNNIAYEFINILGEHIENIEVLKA